MKKVYQVNVSEELMRSFFVIAENADDAESLVREKYRESEIVLDANNYVEDSGKIEVVDEFDKNEVVSEDEIDFDATKKGA